MFLGLVLIFFRGSVDAFINENSLVYDGMSKVAYVSSYPPRECGIATFTKNLVVAAKRLGVVRQPLVVAMNEGTAIYNYDRLVRCQIRRDFPGDYVEAADCVNSSRVDLVNLQHEFGLFGGDWGEYINYFLEKIEQPLVSTFHTVSPSFEPKAQDVLRKIAKHSSKIVTMTNAATKILMAYDIPRSKIKIIQHGCPDIPFVDSNKVKPLLFGLKGKIVLSTFGLISRGKGIEYAIKALPKVIKKYPEIVYLVIGVTHPEVRRIQGERYRNKLTKLVDELGLYDHVKFHNRFLHVRELIRYLQATDIYITPYLEPNQISSGTLVYAMGAGRAIIATPYLHAEEALAKGRGIFCKFRDHRSITKGIIQLLNDKGLRRNMQRRVYRYSRDFTWRKVAKRYSMLFRSVLDT
jgi:glycosyltransferase involved in cell wall biosynthesis